MTIFTFKRVLAIAVIGFLSVVVYDLWGPFRADIRRFDPNETARLETAMWRSYYEKKQVQLFLQLSELLRTQFHLPPFRSIRVAYAGAKAASVFKEGNRRSDYERALPYLEAYFAAIDKIGTLGIDPQQVARVELEWWIVHRERKEYPDGALDRAVAEAAAALYRVPVGLTLEHGRLRSEAMVLRDDRAAIMGGSPSDEDWGVIEELLRKSYRSLAEAVSAGGV